MQTYKVTTKGTLVIRWDYLDVQEIAREQGIELTKDEAYQKFDEIRWGLREALTEAGNIAIADNLGCEATTGAKRL